MFDLNTQQRVSRRIRSSWCGAVRLLACAGLFGLIGFSTVGCGQMTMRTWVTVVAADSGGFVEVKVSPHRPPLRSNIQRIQGGYLARVVLDTSVLPNPMNGHIYLDDVRMAGQAPGMVGIFCTWNDPAGASGGDLTVDLLNGKTTSSLFMDAKAATTMTQFFNLPPVDFEQDVDFDLGAGLGIAQFLAAFQSGSPTGLFDTTTTMATKMKMLGLDATFSMDLHVTNGPTPPAFDADLLAFCNPFFAQQGIGNSFFYGVNAKSSYLRAPANSNPGPLAPLVIPLADIGAVPGDIVRIETVGTYSASLLLRDGSDIKTGGVFSSTDEVLDSSQLFRIPGARDVAVDLNTWPSIVCVFGVCKDFGGDDIAQDFPIDPSRTLHVPSGSNYLIVAPVDSVRIYADNTGMGFGVNITVNP